MKNLLQNLTEPQKTRAEKAHKLLGDAMELQPTDDLITEIIKFIQKVEWELEHESKMGT